MKKASLFILLLAFLSSCVPTKDLIYLQGSPTNKEIREIKDTPYKLQVGDNIIIDVASDNDDLVSIFLKSSTTLNTRNPKAAVFSIDRHGNIRMPTLGEINVLGYSTTEVRLKIEEKISEYFKDNNYFVSVKLDGIKYTIMGEIKVPGLKVMQQNRVSILDAISNSGDIPITGNKKNVEVIRFTPDGMRKISIDLTSINALNSEVFYIKNNDYINVLPVKQKSWGTTTGIQSVTSILSLVSLLTTTIFILISL
jgi:polysaccharide export outer membrane protein